MFPHRFFLRPLLPVLALSLTALAPAARQGQVLSSLKISETAGGFTGVLDEQDQFGRAVAAIGDLDGDGIEDLAIGAPKGTTTAPAVWTAAPSTSCS